MIDVDRVRSKYRRNVRVFDLLGRRLERLRAAAVARLDLRPGDVVLDLGCGTGLSFQALEAAVGPDGRIIGIEVSPHMLERARQKARRLGWRNVTLIEANAEEIELRPECIDGVLCFYTHDIMGSPRALTSALRALRVGGRVVAAGGKRVRGMRGLVLNPLILAYAVPFVTTLSETRRPWRRLEELLGPLEVEERFWGSAYIASGAKRGDTVRAWAPPGAH
jgi:ubiquinone/menaquinone biosynthesis C-methylase UbiE